MKRTKDLSCRGVVVLLDDYLDGQLTPSQRTAVRAHLDACADCATFLRRARLVLATLGSTANGEERSADAQLQRLRDALGNAGS